MSLRRVKITGIGPVTPAGIGREAFWKGIQEPISRVRLIDRFNPEAGPFVGAEVQGFKLNDYLPGVSPKRMPRHTQFALAAAALALRDAGLRVEDLAGRSVAVLVGAALMDFEVINKSVDLIVRNGPISAYPSAVTTASVSSIGSQISQMIGSRARTMTLQSACCSGLDAIGHAAQLIGTGQADMALCGGTEAPLFFHPMLELKMAGLAPGNPENPEQQCRPFDRWRTTGVIGEGCSILLLEAEESPRPARAWIEGYAYASDLQGALCSGLVEAIRLAVATAGLRLPEIECIHAWGPGHRAIDREEAKALRTIFGANLLEVPTASIKGAIGNPLGAAGAIQTAVAAMSLSEGVVPPTVNWTFPDADCLLSLAPVARHVRHRTSLINAHGISGTNACMVLAL